MTKNSRFTKENDVLMKKSSKIMQENSKINENC